MTSELGPKARAVIALMRETAGRKRTPEEEATFAGRRAAATAETAGIEAGRANALLAVSRGALQVVGTIIGLERAAASGQAAAQHTFASAHLTSVARYMRALSAEAAFREWNEVLSTALRLIDTAAADVGGTERYGTKRPSVGPAMPETGVMTAVGTAAVHSGTPVHAAQRAEGDARPSWHKLLLRHRDRWVIAREATRDIGAQSLAQLLVERLTVLAAQVPE